MQRVLCAVPGSGCDLLTQDGSSLCFCALTLFHWGLAPLVGLEEKAWGSPGAGICCGVRMGTRGRGGPCRGADARRGPAGLLDAASP